MGRDDVAPFGDLWGITVMYRIYIIVPDKLKTASQTLFTLITGNPADLDSYNVPLSANGEEPASHWGLSTIATDEQRNALKAALFTDSLHSSSVYAGVMFWVLSADTNILLSPEQNPALGQVMGFDDCLAQVGLLRVLPAEVV